MQLDVDIDFLSRLHREAPYATTDPGEIATITRMDRLKLIDAKVPAQVAEGQYSGPAFVSRVRPRGQAALQNDGDTLI